MITTKRKDIVVYVEHKQVVLKIIHNKGRVVNNTKLPVSCHYCELKWEQQSWC